MKDRLTKRTENGGVKFSNDEYFNICYPQNEHCLRDIDRMAIKLCELEDKIEQGKLVEFPCKVGDKVAVRALCETVITTPCYEECRHICPFEDDCESEECSSLNERIFDTKVSSIFNNGEGWYIEFEHLIPFARFADIGTSFFVGENAHEQAISYNKALERNRQ